MALRHEAEQGAPRLIIEDTDPVATAIWSDQLGVPEFARSLVKKIATYAETAGLYFLTDIDLPWIDDGVRYWPDEAKRQAFKDACLAELESRNLHYVLLSGSWEDRRDRAIDETKRFLFAP